MKLSASDTALIGREKVNCTYSLLLSFSLDPRDVLIAITINEVPIDVLAERMATTRGALYKTLHDARRKLRSTLAARGLGPDAKEVA